MPDSTFDTLLSGQLRAYADRGVRPIDRFAIAEATIATGRSSLRPRWTLRVRRSARLVVMVALLALAVAATVLLAGSRLRTPVTPYVPHSYVDELVSAPDLPVPVTSPAAVLLLDGRVLVFGGGGGDPATAWLYDPATGAAVSAGALLPSGHWINSAIRLLDGRVLILGDGADQIFDPTTMRFAAVGPSVTPRSGATAALLHDGRVLIAGGMPAGGVAATDPALQSAELFDPRTLTSSPTGSIGSFSGGGPMVTLPDGRVYMDTSPVAEIYDPRTGIFTAASATAGGGGHPVVLPDGRVALFGSTGLYDGGSITVWDPVTTTFSTKRLSEPLTGGTLLDDGRVFLIGMCHGRQTGWTGLYDPATEVTMQAPPTQACRPSSTRLADGRVLIVGGTVTQDLVPVRTAEIFR